MYYKSTCKKQSKKNKNDFVFDETAEEITDDEPEWLSKNNLPETDGSEE